MNKFSKSTFRFIAGIQILALTLLTSCAGVASALNSSFADDSSTACHATGDASNPYEEITIVNDISPVPANGCPTEPILISDGKILICHATDSETDPYKEITVSINGLNGHGTHAGDVFPSEGVCPETLVVTNSDKITICHATSSKTNPYNEITVSVNELNGHDKHQGDIVPMPESGCPTTSP